jgi:integrase
MARTINRLSARSAISRGPGHHADGGNLYLVVDKRDAQNRPGARRWVFIYSDRRNGRRREMGLGGIRAVSLMRARELAAENRAILAAGGDPIEDKQRRAREATEEITFGSYVVDRFLETRSAGWKNAKHRNHWRMTLTRHAAPLTDKPMAKISTEDVLAVLKPIWQTKSETAKRLRGRIEHVLDAARATGHRTGDNPARWRGHLDKLLPSPPKLAKGHHAALPYADISAFVSALRAGPRGGGIGALAFEFMILTAARTGEVLLAEWPEIDFKNKVWTVPAVRMKARRHHRVPLSDRAVAILEKAEEFRSSDFVFPGQKPGRPLSSMVFEMTLRRMKVEGATPHGFRSSFRDWAGNETNFPRELAEAALSHTVGDQTERAYRRGDALEKRRKLMRAWSVFCSRTTATHVADLKRSA